MPYLPEEERKQRAIARENLALRYVETERMTRLQVANRLHCSEAMAKELLRRARERRRNAIPEDDLPPSPAMIRLAQHCPVTARALAQRTGEEFTPPLSTISNVSSEQKRRGGY